MSAPKTVNGWALLGAAREWSEWVGFVPAGGTESRLLQAIRDVVMDAPGVAGEVADA